MTHRPFSSLKIGGIFASYVFFIAILSSFETRAQAVDSGDLPVLFDSRERLPKPDLSTISRVRFVTTVDFPPFNFTDQTGRLAGFQVDLIREICDELKIAEKCQVQALPFAEIETAVQSGQAEAAMAGIAVTAELRRRFAFSRPFMMLPARFVRNLKVQLPAGTAVTALNGHAVGVVAGTTHEAMLKAFFPTLRPTAYATRAEMLAGLQSGVVDAVFADSLQLSFWVASPASETCCALFDGPYVSERFLGEGLTIMVSKDDAVLVAAFDHALLALVRNGRLQEIYLRYFPHGLF